MALTLRTARRIAGLTQDQLAKKAGLDQQTVSDLERGKNRNPSWDTVARIAQALNVEPHELFPMPPVSSEGAASSAEVA